MSTGAPKPIKKHQPVESKQIARTQNKAFQIGFDEKKEEETKPAMPEEIKIEFNESFPRDVSNLILSYNDGAFRGLPSPSKNIQYFLFGKNTEALLNPEASELATKLMLAEENEVASILQKVREKPNLAYCYVRVLTPQGQPVCGSWLQVVAMLGDVDLHPNLQNDADRGLVERLKKTANMSDEEVADHIAEVITSEKAIRATEKRNKRALDAIQAFGEAIIQKKKAYKVEYRFEEFQAFCEEPIVLLTKALKPNPNEVITAGLVFDTAIFYHATKWFEDNIKRFGRYWETASDMFWVGGMGNLQRQAMPADARLIRRGLGYWFDGETPARRLRDPNGNNDFYAGNSGLGVDFYHRYSGRRGPPRASWVWLVGWKSYDNQKQKSYKAYAAQIPKP